MNPKTTSPWTAGRKTPLTAAPKVLCVGGRCTWSVGDSPLKLRDTLYRTKTVPQLKGTVPSLKK